MNYEPFIERDLPAIPAVVAEFRAAHSAEETWTAVTRFAVLAFAPSQHSMHALLACLSVWDLREEIKFDEAIVQCAIYAAASRQPWSEPPMLDPPKIDEGQRGDVEELRAAIAASDRLRAERWLASRYDNADFSSDYFAVASDDFEDLGHKLIVASAAMRLADLLGEKGRYAMLRVGIWEMVAVGGGESGVGGRRSDLESLCNALVANVIANDGDIFSAHALFLFDAALQTNDDAVIARVASHLAGINSPTPDTRHPTPQIETYPFARDYGACLKAHAVAKRLRPKFPNADFNGMLAAMHRNLEKSSEEMTFA
ncbi:MAG: hypothetical protein JO093_10550 [Acidobacteria bacterium]|nr:hypothetical protein [Acidobacteriota bacterium]MBV9186057.1 hypothetical protein [Acidobacteriota bacterium]